MSKLSVDKFVVLLEKSKLIPQDQLTQIVADWKAHASLADLEDAQPLADRLIETELLTHWQCKKLFDGRHRGFYLGRYKLLDHVGSGGMSSVYLAEHVLMQRRVAIKVLPHNRVSDSSYLARFHLEAQAAAALDHRNIVRAFDLAQEGRIHFLVMEYIPGRDLHALVCQDGPLDYHVAANYVAQAAAGLDHAHHCGLIHRDIKPANLLVDHNGVVKILDMGLAKFTAANRPTPGISQDEEVLGTADYLAPEQAVNSQTVDERADIYALGCTLYFLLTGHPPFAAGTSAERMTAHQRQHPPSVLIDRPDAPQELVAICRRMMEKLLANRYPTARAVYEALAGWLQSEAAAGKIAANAANAVERQALHGAPSSSGTYGRPKSKANLVSGSGLDLQAMPPELPQASSPFTDTDPNLHPATVKIPLSFVNPQSEEAPTPPPVQRRPPSSQWRVAPPPARDVIDTGDEPLVAPQLIATNTSELQGLEEFPRLRERRSVGHWMLILISTALLLTAILVALFAIPS